MSEEKEINQTSARPPDIRRREAKVNYQFSEVMERNLSGGFIVAQNKSASKVRKADADSRPGKPRDLGITGTIIPGVQSKGF